MLSPLLLCVALPDFAPPNTLLPDRLRSSRIAKNFLPVNGSASDAHTLFVPLNWSAFPSSPTFEIRYFTDSSSFEPSDPNAPIFVGMGGEGTAHGAHCSALARKHKALCVGVEHRFYGKSLPKDGGASTANYWAGLSVEANLADTMAVVDHVQATNKIGAKRRPVIANGGSYSGATCAWFRQSYPDKVDACVSASGVVNAILDFPQFDEHVGKALSGTCPEQCAFNLAAAYTAVDAAFDAGRGDEVKKLFNATNLIGTKMGDSDFFYAIADGPAMLDQYGNKAELCDGLSKLPAEPTDMERLENLGMIISHHYGDSFAADCFYDSECVKNATAPDPKRPSELGGLNSRSWRFEKCSEVAYLQSAPLSGRKLRSKRLTIKALLDQCEYVFGPGTVARLRARNANLNKKFGGADPSSVGASNIFYLDFSDDPWAEASVKKAGGEALPFCFTKCDGCGHCGAGVPASKRECFDKSDAFVDGVLEKWRRGE